MKVYTDEEIEKTLCEGIKCESCQIINQLRAQLKESEETVASLRADIQAGVKDILMGMYRATGVICAYCGDVPVDKENHWETCDKHPAGNKLKECQEETAKDCLALMDEIDNQEPDYEDTFYLSQSAIRKKYNIKEGS